MKHITRPAIALLTAFHLLVLTLALQPDVSDEYREYYISRTSDLSPTEKKRLVPLKAGTAHSHLDPALVFEGWGEPDARGRRNTRRSARITFRLYGPARDQILVVGLRSSGASTILCSLNQAPAQEFKLKEETLIRLPVVATPGSSDIARLDFRFPDIPGARENASTATIEFLSLEIRNKG